MVLLGVAAETVEVTVAIVVFVVLVLPAALLEESVMEVFEAAAAEVEVSPGFGNVVVVTVGVKLVVELETDVMGTIMSVVESI
jgi:hypothetical protein